MIQLRGGVKGGNRRRVTVEGGSKFFAQDVLFKSNYRDITKQKVGDHKNPDPNRSRNAAKSNPDQKTSEVKWVANHAIGTASREYLLFSQVAGSPDADRFTSNYKRKANPEIWDSKIRKVK